MPDTTGLAEAMLGLPGFRVLGVDETPAEVVIQIETSAATWRPSAALRAWCGQSGAGAVRSPCARPEPGARSPPRSPRDVF